MMGLGKAMANQYEESPGIAAPDMHFDDAASAAQPAESAAKPPPNIAAPSQPESLLAAEKQTLEKMANGASLSEVLDDLCASIDAHAPCYFNGLFDERRVAVPGCRAPCPRHI